MTTIPRLLRPTSAARAPRPVGDDSVSPSRGAAPEQEPPLPPPRDHVSVDFSTPDFRPPDDETG